MSDPRILTAAEHDLLTTDLDDWLDQENCECEGTCTCQEEDL